MTKVTDTGSYAVDPITTTIAASATVSATIDMRGMRLAGLIIPASMTSTALTFNVSNDGSTFVPLKDTTNAAISITIDSSAAAYPLVPMDFIGWRYLQVVAGSAEASDRTISLNPYLYH